ncbi:hypothetical protein HD553DRAFT_337968 [Filobasidium floriforme]|uniref:uncharacterized protein n=1 Tax=Filobasidium floriforme TaxID=5210 RepID=UPI001E8CD827|nr:uncharacterized protein HD553DRAFT_337968 [Filobasidium floriforme]KAH8090280.1 hypothetical protein HD553DRAFT_337968 [Filobasidium floriforme]
MPQEYLDNETFLTRLESAFKTASEEGSRAGSVWLTHKRYTYQEDPASPNQNQNANPDVDGDVDADDVEMEAVNSSTPTTTTGGEKEYEVLVRCTNGSDLNFSTRIPAPSLPQFHTLYASYLRSQFASTMIKRDKKKEKLKAEKREAWKKDLLVDVRTESRVEGTGKKVGHRQRARRLQAQRKKEAQREELEERERTSTRPGV